MSSESSLVTTAASDTSSSADSRYFSGGAHQRNLEYPTREATSNFPQLFSSTPLRLSPASHFHRRRKYNLKALGVVIAKNSTPSGVNQKVFCVCKSCKGQRMVSKSTCYRHLKVEAEIAEDNAKWDYARWVVQKNVTSSHQGSF